MFILPRVLLFVLSEKVFQFDFNKHSFIPMWNILNSSGWTTDYKTTFKRVRILCSSPSKIYGPAFCSWSGEISSWTWVTNSSRTSRCIKSIIVPFEILSRVVINFSTSGFYCVQHVTQYRHSRYMQMFCNFKENYLTLLDLSHLTCTLIFACSDLQ